MEKTDLIRTIEQCKTGDATAQEKLILEVQQSVYYQCLKMLRHESNAQDATQEILISMLTSLDKLQEPAAFWGWLNTMTMNRCRNQLSRGYKECQIPEDEEGNSLLDQYETLDEQEIPDQSLDTAETRRMIAELVDALPDNQRMAVLMYYYDEMSVKDIAQAMETSEGTVKSRLNYARKSIKEGVERYEKQGVKLYSVSVFPFLLYFLRKDAETSGLSQEQVMQLTAKTLRGVSAVGAAASGATAATSAASSGGSTAVKVLANTAAKAGMGLGAKIAVGALAAAVVVGGGVAIGHQMEFGSSGMDQRYRIFYNYVKESDPGDQYLLLDPDQDGENELVAFQTNGDFFIWDIVSDELCVQFAGYTKNLESFGTLTYDGKPYYAYRNDIVEDMTSGYAVPQPAHNPYFELYEINDQMDSDEFYGHSLNDFPISSEEPDYIPRFDREPISQAAFQAAIDSFHPLQTADSSDIMDQQTCLKYLKTQM